MSNIPTLRPLPIEGCRNIRPGGLITVPSGPLAGTVLPLFEMTDLNQNAEADVKEKEEAT